MKVNFHNLKNNLKNVKISSLLLKKIKTNLILFNKIVIYFV